MNTPDGPKKSSAEKIQELEASGLTPEQIEEGLEEERDDQPEKREVESLEATFRDDLQEIFKDLPRIRDVLDRKERATLNLTASEAQAVSAKTLWLLSSWVRSLAAEVDRLHDELDTLAGGDSDSQGHS
jgi:hypothetical protein